MFDVVIIGGGPAGLSAALMLGRCRRRVLLCDSGQPRNRWSRGLHGYLTRDGVAPADFNQMGRTELEVYGIDLRPIAVEAVEPVPDGFRVSLADRTTANARFVLIATGVCDHLPVIPGFEDCYGRSVFHCPYCDGWERRDQPLAVFGQGESGAKLALGLKTWSRDIILFSHGGSIGSAARARLARNAITVRTEAIVGLEHDDGQLSAVSLANGDRLPRSALFFTTGQNLQSDLARSLGCTINRRGTVRTGALSGTNVPGVFVAGDASHDAQFVVVAASEGVKAAVAINTALQATELVP